ncbi:Uncharacterised protein [Vibrio cholerae]|nr:Uncharacterised protein [Vibrio cholerae]
MIAAKRLLGCQCRISACWHSMRSAQGLCCRLCSAARYAVCSISKAVMWA